MLTSRIFAVVLAAVAAVSAVCAAVTAETKAAFVTICAGIVVLFNVLIEFVVAVTRA